MGAKVIETLDKEALVEEYTKEAEKLISLISNFPKARTLRTTHIQGFARGQLSIYQKLIFKLKTKD